MIKTKKGLFAPVKNGNRGKWIRPVTKATHGEVPSHLVKNLKLFDLVEIDFIKSVSNGYQSENILFKPESLKVVGKIKPSIKNIKLIVDDIEIDFFGNHNKRAVHKDYIDAVSYSLLSVLVTNPKIVLNTDYNKIQYRMHFNFNNTEYDLPITDVNFAQRCGELVSPIEKEKIINGETFITVSLGAEHENFHSKLVAGVITL